MLTFKTDSQARAFFAQIGRAYPPDRARAAGVAAVERELVAPVVSLRGDDL